MNEEAYFNALRLVYDCGIKQFDLVIKHFRTAKRAFSAPVSAFLKFDTTKNLREKLEQRSRINVAEEYERMKSFGISLLTIHSREYPKQLREIASPPPLLYFRGNISLASAKNLVAMVGTRRATNYGKTATKKIGSELARAGCVLVSGMAFGIDSEAHKAALENDMPTIAVLGSSLDDASIYPRSNLGLAKNIIQTGLILSEFPIPTSPRKENFPRRNRIVSGISRGVIVTEAKEPSGALITAFFALEQNREVFSVPGSIFAATSQGCHKLISMGAKLTQSADDVLQELGISRNLLATKETNVVLQALAVSPLGFDEILKVTRLSQGQLFTELTKLEIDQRVAKNNGMYYKV